MLFLIVRSPGNFFDSSEFKAQCDIALVHDTGSLGKQSASSWQFFEKILELSRQLPKKIN